MARLRSPVAVSQSGTASAVDVFYADCFGWRLTFLGGRCRRVGGHDERGTQGVCSRTAAMVRAMEFGPAGEGQARCPFSGWHFLSGPQLDCPARAFPARRFPPPSSPDSGGNHQRQRFCGFFLRS